jgi:hypothetical protein
MKETELSGGKVSNEYKGFNPVMYIWQNLK